MGAGSGIGREGLGCKWDDAVKSGGCQEEEGRVVFSLSAHSTAGIESPLGLGLPGGTEHWIGVGKTGGKLWSWHCLSPGIAGSKRAGRIHLRERAREGEQQRQGDKGEEGGPWPLGT